MQIIYMKCLSYVLEVVVAGKAVAACKVAETNRADKAAAGKEDKVFVADRVDKVVAGKEDRAFVADKVGKAAANKEDKAFAADTVVVLFLPSLCILHTHSFPSRFAPPGNPTYLRLASCNTRMVFVYKDSCNTSIGI